MKVTHVIESTGGSLDFVLYLVKYIPEHEHVLVYGRRTFLAFGGRYDDIKTNYPNLKLIYWDYAQREINLLKDILAWYTLFRILRKAKPDVVHLHSSKAGFIGRLVCFALRSKNVLYTPNGLPFLREDVPLMIRRFYILLEKFANTFSGKVVACSKSECVEMKKIGIPATYVNNGTEIIALLQKRAGEKLVIGTTGRVTTQKNPLLFNRIANYFVSNPSVEFLWIGDGELKHVLSSPNIRITGWVTREEVIGNLSEVDIYVSTALWEGLPFAVLEAMNLGKPLVLSKCVGNIDLVNGNGFIFTSFEEAVNHLDQLISNRNLISSLGVVSYKLVENEFNVRTMAKSYKIIYAPVTLLVLLFIL
jgi:glycosyltransferase involved in cell wall biosynthesis